MNEKEIMQNVNHPFITKLDYIFQTVNFFNIVKLSNFCDGILSRWRFFHSFKIN